MVVKERISIGSWGWRCTGQLETLKRQFKNRMEAGVASPGSHGEIPPLPPPPSARAGAVDVVGARRNPGPEYPSASTPVGVASAAVDREPHCSEPPREESSDVIKVLSALSHN